VDSFVSFIIVDVAAKMCAKEETERQDLLLEKQEIMQGIASNMQRNIEVVSPEPDSGVTLFNLKLQVRQRSNTVMDKSISEIELEQYINNSYSCLQDILEEATGNYYFLDAYEFNITSGRSEYDLPADFNKLGGVDLVLSTGNIIALQRFNFAERTLHESNFVDTTYGSQYFHYEIYQNSLKLLPVPSSGYTARMWYSKKLSVLSKEASAVPSVILRDWTEYIVIDSAIKVLTKKLVGADQNSLIGIQAALGLLQEQKQEMYVKLRLIAENRIWGAPMTVVDTESLSVRQYLDWK
jgi:hypothetical protein